MESIHDSGRTRMLGVRNFRIEQLQRLWPKAHIRPRLVQNRCYASLGWERQVRAFCRDHDMVYQGFSLLTANRETLAAAPLVQIVARHRRTIPQIVFRFAIQIGMIPLMGTTASEHMQADLEVFDLRLEPAEIARIAGWDLRSERRWFGRMHSATRFIGPSTGRCWQTEHTVVLCVLGLIGPRRRFVWDHEGGPLLRS